MNRYGQYIGKGILKHIRDIDMKYISVFNEKDYIQGLLIPYIYENTMIMD